MSSTETRYKALVRLMALPLAHQDKGSVLMDELFLMSHNKGGSMNRVLSILVVVLSFSLAGCMKPQIMSPYSTGFAPDEYLVIRAVGTDQMGQLFIAEPEFDKDGKQIPLRWQGASKLIFPTSTTINKVVPSDFSQERYAFEKIGNSFKFTAAAIVDARVANDSAYKYESKSESVKRLDMTTLSYAQPVADYMSSLLSTKPKLQFSYLSAIYYGTAFVETLTNINTGGGGNYAAFQMGDDYYKSTNTHLSTAGPIIFQLTMLDPREVGIQPPVVILPVTVPTKLKRAPIANDELLNIKSKLPLDFKMLLEK